MPLRKIAHNLFLFSAASVFSFLLFYLFLHPLDPTFFLGRKILAATGISNSASVPLNPVNKIAMQLDAKEKELAERERAISQREGEAARAGSPWHNPWLSGMIILLIILSVLMGMNFYFDTKRKNELELLEELEKKQRAFGP